MPPLQADEHQDDYSSISSSDAESSTLKSCPSDDSNESTFATSSGQKRTDNNNKDSRRKQRQNSRNKKKKKKNNKLSDRERSKIVALDCEMVGVGIGGRKSMLARVCVINCEGMILLDTYVQTTARVTDYRTHVSGITKEHLLSINGAISFERCRILVKDLLKGKLLVGHALQNDLEALKINHPKENIRDTANGYEPFMKYRHGYYDDGMLWPRKLKDLAKEKLNRKIQARGVAHSPYQDAKAALDLYKLVRLDWEQSIINGRKHHQQMQQYYYHMGAQLQQHHQHQNPELLYHYDQGYYLRMQQQQQMLTCGYGN